MESTQKRGSRWWAGRIPMGALALAPGSIPDRGLSDEAYAQYRAILATTGYLETAVAETKSFGKNLTEVRTASITNFGDMPLIVLSRGIWDPLPSVSETENQRAWQPWQALQSELAELSTDSKHVIAGQSGHPIQLQQPQLVIHAIREIVQAAHK